MKPEIVSEEPLLMAELKSELDKIKKRDEEPNFRVAKTEEYLDAFVEQKPTKARELVKKLQDLDIPRLKDIHIYKLVDLMPASVNEAQVILQGYSVAVSQDNLKKVISALNE